jgi:glycosyltransferase involved in cell wall biosynthesis
MGLTTTRITDRNAAPEPAGTSRSRLRVCQVISSFHPVVAGAEKATHSLVRELRARDHDVVVLTRRYSREWPRAELVDGVPVYRLGWPGRGKINALTFGIHALALLAGRLRDWHIIHVQNIDTPLFVGLLARLLLRRDLVATIHGHTPILGKNTRLLGRLRTRTMARVVQRFTSINPDNTTALEEIGVPRQHIREIPNGVDMTVFRPPTEIERAAARGTLGLAAGDFVAVYIGRLVAWKRVDLLLDGWSRLAPEDRDVLLVVGDGSESAALRDRASALGPSVRFEGPTNDPVAYLWAADVFVNASGDNQLAGEGLSVALLESMAVGVPPIVTKGPGNDVVVEDGVTGLNFPVKDPVALEVCLRRMQQDPGLRQRLAAGAHELANRQYSIAVVAQQVEAMYRSLAGIDGR